MRFPLTATTPAVKIRPLVAAFDFGSAVVLKPIADRTGKKLRRSGGLLVAGTFLSAAGGCLNLGGRTTYVQTSPETDARFRALETRVGALEQAVTTRAATMPLNESGVPLIGQSNSSPQSYRPGAQASDGPIAR